MTILVKSGPETKTLEGHNSRTGWNFEKRKTPQMFSMIAQQTLMVRAKSNFLVITPILDSIRNPLISESGIFTTKFATLSWTVNGLIL